MSEDGAAAHGDGFRRIAVSLTEIEAQGNVSFDADSSELPNEHVARAVRGLHASLSPSERDASVHVALAPGRVNLIGEHIDYEGYSVLPMAITQRMAVAITSSLSSTSDAGVAIRIANSDPSYTTATVSLSQDRVLAVTQEATNSMNVLFEALADTLDASTSWARYVLCGLMAAVERMPSRMANQPLVLDVYVDGAVPPACGLSSSSALVVASALAFTSEFCSQDDSLPTRTQLADTCRYAEHYVGTAGGGMDQAVSCLAARDAALFVSFEPRLHVEQVAFPPEFQRGEAVFLVVNSGVQAHKAQDATTRFNTRVVECALASKLLGKRLGVDGWEKMTGLSELHRALEVQRCRGLDFAELLAEAAVIASQSEFLRDELAAELSPTEPLATLFHGTRLEKAATLVLNVESQFRLHQRVLHVWGEAARVLAFRQFMLEQSPDPARLGKLGKLMLESHMSCRELYECSCDELDAIVETAVQGGAYGARLTGAGWGGCAVLLVAASRVNMVRQRLEAEHFASAAALEASPVVESRAADGAQLFAVQGPV